MSPNGWGRQIGRRSGGAEGATAYTHTCKSAAISGEEEEERMRRNMGEQAVIEEQQRSGNKYRG